jgi:hypothetical protein
LASLASAAAFLSAAAAAYFSASALLVSGVAFGSALILALAALLRAGFYSGS